MHKPSEWVAHQVQTGFQVFILRSGLGRTVELSSPTHTANRAKKLQTRKNHACLCGAPPRVPPAPPAPVCVRPITRSHGPPQEVSGQRQVAR